MKNRSNGLTLIEVLVTLALVAILTSLAVPSYRSQFAKRATEAAADAFVSDMRFARSEALKRNTYVTLCRSSDGSSCSGANGLWRDGWIVFIDSDFDGTVDAADGDEVLRVQQQLSGIASIAAPANGRHFYPYRATGSGAGLTDQLIFTPSGSVPANTTQLVCISSQGRASLAKQGTSAC